MNSTLRADDLRRIMADRYGKDDELEHPMTAAGVVLLAAGMHGITSPRALTKLTGYSNSFISGLVFNLRNNHLWTDRRYDATWLKSDGSMNDLEFWEHIGCACGVMWFPSGDAELAIDICQIYWRDKDSRGRQGLQLADWDGLECYRCDQPAMHVKVDIEDCADDLLILEAFCESHYNSNVRCFQWLHKPPDSSKSSCKPCVTEAVRKGDLQQEDKSAQKRYGDPA